MRCSRRDTLDRHPCLRTCSRRMPRTRMPTCALAHSRSRLRIQARSACSCGSTRCTAGRRLMDQCSPARIRMSLSQCLQQLQRHSPDTFDIEGPRFCLQILSSLQAVPRVPNVKRACRFLVPYKASSVKHACRSSIPRDHPQFLACSTQGLQCQTWLQILSFLQAVPSLRACVTADAFVCWKAWPTFPK